MFVIKKIGLVLSMIIISYVGNAPEDSKSFFVSWFIFLLLIVIDYIENFNYKKIENKTRAMYFYFTGIVLFGCITFFNLLGSFGLITIKENLEMQGNNDYIFVKGLFSLIQGYNWNIEVYILVMSSLTIFFFVGEFFCKPALTYREKHKLKYEGRKEELSSDTN